MERSPFIPANPASFQPELICRKCGQSFRPHCVGEDVEEFCCDCYEEDFVQSFDYDEAAVAAR